MSRPAATLDIDGTLVGTNYDHAIAWYRALVAALAGEEFEAAHGDDVRDAEKALYMALIHEVRPLKVRASSSSWPTWAAPGSLRSPC